MDRRMLSLALVVAVVVLASGCISGDVPAGTEARPSIAENVSRAGQDWLAGEEGQAAYPGGMPDDIVVIYIDKKEYS